MRKKWNFNQPKAVFESYNNEVKLYVQKLKTDEKLRGQIEALEKKIEKSRKEAEALEARIRQYQKSAGSESGSEFKKERDREKKALQSEDKDYENLRAELLKEKNTEYEREQAYYQGRLDRLNKSESLSVDELSSRAQKSLEIEREKQEFLEEAGLRLREAEAGFVEETARAEAEIGRIEAEIAALIADYEPKMAGVKQSIVEKIGEKEEFLQGLNSSLAELEAGSEKVLYGFELEQERLEVLDSRSDQAIEANSSFKVRYEEAQKKAKEEINSKKSEFQSALAEAEAAIGHLRSELGKLIAERDDKIKALDDRMQELKKEVKAGQQALLAKYEEEEKLEEDKKAELEAKILNYARSQGIDHRSNYDMLLGRFKSLQARTGIWRALVSEIAIKDVDRLFEVELIKQRQKLDKLSYEDLEAELKQAEKAKAKLGAISKKPQPFVIAAVFITVFGLIVFGLSFLERVQQPVLQMWGGIVLAVLGLFFLFFALGKPKKDLRRLCRFISLSEDNESFDAIEKRAISDTETQEVSGMKEAGELIWLKNLGAEGLNSARAKRETELGSYYDKRMELLERAHQNKRAEIARGTSLDIAKAELKFFLDTAAMDMAGLSRYKDLNFAKAELSSYDEILGSLKAEKDGLASDIEGFKANYAELLKKLGDRNWIEPLTEAEPALKSEFYLVHGGEYRAEKELLLIDRLDFDYAPILVTYDNYLLNHDSDLMAGELGSMLMDFVKAFYRLNPSTSLGQYVYGETYGLKEAMNSQDAESYGLKKVLTGEEDVDSLAGEAERDYTILYYVFKARDAEGRIEGAGERVLETLRSKAKKALIPVYICYYGALEDSKDAEGSGYGDYMKEAGLVLNYSNTDYKIEKR